MNNTERYEPDPADLWDEVWFYPYPRKGFEVAAPASSLPLPIPVPEELDSFEDDEF